MKAKYVGIDLGTTTSGLAYLKPDGSPEIVPNADGERLTPSVVYFDKMEGIKLVGSAARDGGDPDRTVHAVKRFMDDPNYVVNIDGEKWTPTEISALILKKLRQDCSQIIGEIEDVVITVPANFNELARNATIAAAKIAGLNVMRLVNEPTAAALYYAHVKNISGRVLVYDLGGGTLDVTVLDVKDDDIKILLSEGARHLGGANFDERVLRVIDDHYRAQTNSPLFRDMRSKQRSLQTCEDMKKMLSKLRQVSDTVGNENEGLARIQLSRDMFEEAVGKLLMRTEMLVEQALDSIDCSFKDINHVVMVGGSTRMPSIRSTLKKQFGFDPISCGNVDECVALGAALFAKKGANVSEVCNTGYGTLALLENADTGEEKFCNTIVIPKNTPIPCSITESYQTAQDNESTIEVEITQGEDDDPKYVDVIGKISLEVPEGRPAGCQVSVTYSYDENQRVKALVVDEQTGISKDVEINYHGDGVLTADQIEQKVAYLRKIRVE